MTADAAKQDSSSIDLIRDLLTALENLVNVQAYATGWDNGVTDPTGTINEADYFHGMIMDRARAAIDKAQKSLKQSEQRQSDVGGIYAASRASVPERGALWRSLRAQGWPIVSTWIDEDGETLDFSVLWPRIEREVSSASRLIFYAEPTDFPLKGALVEVGMAIAFGVPVFAVLPGVDLQSRSMHPVGSWLAHPSVKLVGSIEEALW